MSNIYDPSSRLPDTCSKSSTGVYANEGTGRILVVNDEQPIREVICTMLATVGYEYLAVAGGEEALAILESGANISLLTHDLLNLPMDGYELLLKTRQRFPSLPVIVLTCVHDADIIGACLRAGAFDYIVMPFERAQLLTAVHRALEYRRRDAATTH